MRIGAGAPELDTPVYYLQNGSLMDDFRFYNRVLNSIEIYRLYSGSQIIQYKFDENLNDSIRATQLLPVTSAKNLVNNGGVYSFDSSKNSLLLSAGKDATFLPGINWSNYNDLTIAGWFKTTSFQNNDTILKLQYTFDDFEMRHPIISSNFYAINTITPNQVSTDYYIAFTDPSVTYTLTVQKNISCELLVVGGGGAGGHDGSGGGGGGQVKFYTNRSASYKSGNAFNLSAGTYTISVGIGGTAGYGRFNGVGKPSIIRDSFNNIVLYSGGGGGGGNRAEYGGNAMGGGGGAGHSGTFIGGMSTNDVYPIIWYNFNEDPTSITKYATNYLYDNSILNEDINGLTVNSSDKLITRRRNGLLFKIYTGYFSDDTNWFLNRTPLSSTYQGFTTNISDIGVGTNGIVATNSSWENYSVEWFGYFYATVSGTWTFYTNSDDASYLWIGPSALSGYTTGNCLINNGGRHGMQEYSNTITLVAGIYYPFRVQFGEGGGDDNCIISFLIPGNSTRIYDGFGYYYSFPSKYHMKINSFHNDTSNLSHWYYFDSSSYYIENYGNTQPINNLILPSNSTNQALLDINDTLLRSTPLTIESDVLYTTVGSYTFTVPADTYMINVLCIGGGGGGGGIYNSGGGGGGGLVWANNISVIPGQTFTVVVGGGGGDSGNGGNSSFTGNNITLTADRKSTRLNSSHMSGSRMPSSA